MAKLICPRCRKVFESAEGGRCPNCGLESSALYHFRNSEEFLEREVARALEDRRSQGLEGLVGGLEFVIINTEVDRQKEAVGELLDSTGLRLYEAFEDGLYRTCVLGRGGSADILVRSRKGGKNPFEAANRAPRTAGMPNTRLETFVFGTPDIEKYFERQRAAGAEFLTDAVIHTDTFSFVQTRSSRFTGNSLGFVQWRRGGREHMHSGCRALDLSLEGGRDGRPEGAGSGGNTPDGGIRGYLKNVRALDHVATRVKAEDRDAAIVEFLKLTDYDFDFAIYVDVLNSITNVARLEGEGFAMVFTSGITPYVDEARSGPTERFAHNYGPRAHHMAFRTERIEETFEALKRDGLEFMIELVGSREEGLKQTFTMPSRHTMLVNEYIHRYEGFDGFFIKNNVTELTRATGRQ